MKVLMHSQKGVNKSPILLKCCTKVKNLDTATPGSGLLEKYDGGGGGVQSLGISFLGTVYGFRVSLLSLCIF